MDTNIVHVYHIKSQVSEIIYILIFFLHQILVIQVLTCDKSVIMYAFVSKTMITVLNIDVTGDSPPMSL